MPVTWTISGSAGVIAAVAAVLICLISGWVAIWATVQLVPPSQPSAHVLVGMFLRSGPPLLACLLVAKRLPWLVDAGFGWVLLVAYGLTLTYETLLTVAELRPRTEPVAR
jgi:hypothetical protein